MSKHKPKAHERYIEVFPVVAVVVLVVVVVVVDVLLVRLVKRQVVSAEVLAGIEISGGTKLGEIPGGTRFQEV